MSVTGERDSTKYPGYSVYRIVIARGLVGFVLALVALWPWLRPAAAITLGSSGFVKDFFVVQDPVSLDRGSSATPEAAPMGKMVANNLRIRANVTLDLAEGLAVNGSYNIVGRLQNTDAAALLAFQYDQQVSTYRIDDVNAALWPSPPRADDTFVVLQNLDRLFLTWRASGFDLYAGRQAIAWGSAKSVNPTDVVAPFRFTDIDTEHRVGVDALRVRVPTGALGEVDGGYVFGTAGRWEESAAYLRGKGYLVNTDVSSIAMAFRRNLLFGLDVARAVFGAGCWVEGAAVIPEGDAASYVRVTGGLDYSLPNAVYVFLEYHYNGAGASEPGGYGERLGDVAYTEGGVYLVGRHYLSPGITGPLTPLLTVGGSLLANLGDGSVLFAPTVEYSLLQDFYLSAGAFVGFGASPRAIEGGAFPAPPSVVPGTDTVGFESEFGAYTDTYFLATRYYF